MQIDPGVGPRRRWLAVLLSVCVLAVVTAGSAAAVDPPSSGYLRFDGADDRVDLGQLDVVGSALTLEARVNADDLANCDARDCRIISKATGTRGAEHYWMISTYDAGAATRLRFRLQLDGAVTTLKASSGDMVDDTWYHVAATYDGTTMRLYLDGTVVGAITVSGAISTNPSVDAWIGDNPGRGPGGRPWSGSIDEVRIWDVARTQDAIQNDMADELTGQEPGLVAYYKLNEGTGQVVGDSSPLDNDAIVGSSAAPDDQDPTWQNVAPDGDGPSAPIGVEASVTADQVVLKWAPKTGTIAVSSYVVERNGQVIGTSDIATFRDDTVTPSTSYEYVIFANDAAGNRSPGSDPLTVQTPALQGPSISAVQATMISPSSIAVTWVTDVPSTSQVDYGLTTDYDLETPLGPELTRSHSVDLNGLIADTTYHFRVKSQNEAGTESTSANASFTTSSGDDLSDALPFAGADDIADGAIRGVTAVDLADVSGDGLLDVGLFDGGLNSKGRVTLAWMESPSDPGTDAWTRHDVTLPAATRPFFGAAKLGDVDGDGDPDMVVAMDNKAGQMQSAFLYWLENPRDGSGDWPTNPAGGTEDWPVHAIMSDYPLHHINDMELADMDGDGKLDVVFRSANPNRLYIFFQDGPDTWSEKFIDTIEAVSPNMHLGEGFMVGDIDRRNQLDITIVGYWLEAPADPRTQDYVTHSIDSGYSEVTPNSKEDIGDVNGDGRNDVIISPAEGFADGQNHVLAWYEAPADPTSTDAWTQHVLVDDYNGAHTVRLADLDGDGDLDALSGVPFEKWGQTKNITVWYWSRSAGAFVNPQTIVTGKGAYTGVTGDIGGDGDIDIVAQDRFSGGSRPYLYENLTVE